MLIKWTPEVQYWHRVKFLREHARMQKVIGLRGKEILEEVTRRFGLKWEEAEG